MADPRITKLAQTVINYSVALKPGEKVMIHCTVDSMPFAKALIRQAYAAGAWPFISFTCEDLQGEINAGADKDYIDAMVEYEAWKIRDMDAIIYIRAEHNQYENMVASKQQRKNVSKWIYDRQKQLGLNNKRRGLKTTVLTFPTYMAAYTAKMSLEQFEDIYYTACLADYPKMAVAMNKLADLMRKTENVRILAEGTDLQFSIKGRPIEVSAGTWNMPDGEVYCVPELYSANGRITYNLPSPQRGYVFEKVCLDFKDGKIINATAANHTKELNDILDTDPGARYVGEFAFGLNPYITKPVGSVLFDEKMVGTIHFTPGNEIERIGNGNKSQIHWDLIQSHMPEYGGGEVWFDGSLIRKDGRFIPEELNCLNPENLM